MAFGLGSLWLSVWFVLNVGLTLLNKGILAKVGFKYPILMSFMHQSISTFFSFVESMFSTKDNEKIAVKNDLSIDQFERTVMYRIVLLSLLFTMNIVTGNMSLNYCSVAFTQVVRAIIPIITMIFSHFFLKQKYGMQHIISCVIISVGVALSCLGELNLSCRGFLITIIGCLLSSAKSISIKMVLSGQYTLKSADLLARISPFSAIEMFALAFFDGEPQMIFSPKSKYNASLTCVFFSVISGIMAYFLNLTNFLATQYTSPLTVTIAGCVKQITTIIISVMLFDKRLTLANIMGIIITTIGSSWYSLIGFTQERRKQSDTTESSTKPLVSSQNNVFPTTKDYEISSNDDIDLNNSDRPVFGIAADVDSYEEEDGNNEEHIHKEKIKL